MKAYRIVFLLLTLTLALFLYGAFSAPRMTPEPSQKEVITVWGWDDFLPDAFAEYQKSHPDVALNYTVVEKSEYLQRFKLALALNQPCLLYTSRTENQPAVAVGLKQLPRQIGDDQSQK